MDWVAILTVFFFGTFKFMFAPFTGSAWELSFWETFLSSAAGGTFSAAFFFFFSEFVRNVLHRRRMKKERAGKLKKKKTFTKTNRFIIRLKRTFGIYGICFWAPFFLSVPIGSVIAAKFYGKFSHSFFLIMLGMFLNSFIMTSIAYLIVPLFK